MKRIVVTIAVDLWVPEDRYTAPGSLSILATHIRDAVDKPLNEWASQPEMARGDTLVSLEVRE